MCAYEHFVEMDFERLLRIATPETELYSRVVGENASQERTYKRHSALETAASPRDRLDLQVLVGLKSVPLTCASRKSETTA